jgi:hypothetical protein
MQVSTQSCTSNLQFDQRLALAQRERERVRLLRFWQTAADVEYPQGRLTGAERQRLERKIKDVEMEVRSWRGEDVRYTRLRQREENRLAYGGAR